jgi:hypothetical protein
MMLRLPKRMKVHPSMVLTPEDWIADVEAVYEDGSRESLRIGVSRYATEDSARQHINAMLRLKRVHIADIAMRRRWQRYAEIEPDDPERLARFTRSVG